MGNDLIASYRLLYFQPDPEDGERVCVALLFNAQRDVDLLYDPEFPKLRCLAPRIDPDLVRLYLEDLSASVKRNSSDVDVVLKRHSPQLVASEARRSVWPLSAKARLYFLKRFLSVEGYVTAKSEHLRAEKNDQVKDHLRRLLLQSLRVRREDLQEDVKAQWVLGRKVPQIKSVAFALRKQNGVVLIDGVDLTVLTPESALKRVTKVVHTFWQYGRLKQMEFDRPTFRRIGVVLNGTTNLSAVYRDTHEFALYEFKREADVAIDTASLDDIRKLHEELAQE